MIYLKCKNTLFIKKWIVFKILPMKLTFIFSTLVAASMFTEMRARGDNLVNNALKQYSSVTKAIYSKAEALKKSIEEKFRKQAKKDEDDEEPNSEQIKEFLAEISKHFQKLKEEKEAAGEDENLHEDPTQNKEESATVEREEL